MLLASEADRSTVRGPNPKIACWIGTTNQVIVGTKRIAFIGGIVEIDQFDAGPGGVAGIVAVYRDGAAPLKLMTRLPLAVPVLLSWALRPVRAGAGCADR